MIDEWANYTDLFNLKTELAKLPDGTQIELGCLSEEEARWYSEMLTDEERRKIARYTWTTFESSKL
jgi:hypothetical protein